MSHVLGIDLGTSYSATAVLSDDGHPRILTNADGSTTMPSVVLFQDWGSGDEPLVGIQAKNMAATAPMDTVQYVKRQMGDPHWRFDSSSGAEYTAEEISAIILRRLKADAELALGEPVSDAVITVPAYFDDARRTATKQAGAIAGLNVLRVLNEPTAAALSYGLDNMDSGTILVYDLGGGTFDVTLMSVRDGSFEVIATDGDRNLGGFDFDNAIVMHVVSEVEKSGASGVLEHADTVAALREKAEQAKKALTSVESTTIHVNFEGKNYRVPLSRETFAGLTEPLVVRTREITEDVLEDANGDWEDVDRILLIGGSTRMPMIREEISRLSGITPELDVNPDEAVALGAAVQAAISAAEANADGTADGSVAALAFGGVVPSISDVTSHTLGTLALSKDDSKELNFPLICRNEPIPTSGSSEFATTVDNQRRVTVEVTQGDGRTRDEVIVLGESTLDLPPYPKGSPLRISFHYDIDQTVFVEVFDLVTDESIGTFQVERAANLSEADVQNSAAKIRSLPLS